MALEIFIDSALTGALLASVEVPADATIRDVRLAAQKITHSRLRLLNVNRAAGQLLRDNETCAASGIKDKDHILAAIRPSVVPMAIEHHGPDGNVVAVAKLNENGSVTTEGGKAFGGNCSAVQDELSKDVDSIYSSGMAFAALKDDGSIVAWGHRGAGGDTSAVQEQLTSGVQTVAAATSGFAALTNQDSVVVWGGFKDHGKDDQLASDVQNIFSIADGFAVLKKDRSLVAIGLPEATAELDGVRAVCSTKRAFAALKDDGSVVCWGCAEELPRKPMETNHVQEQLDHGVKNVSSTQGAFAALKEDGSVVVWGEESGFEAARAKVLDASTS